jgi:hypothetical protein
VSATTQEQTAAAEEMTASTEELAAMAADLQHLVGTFKTSNSQPSVQVVSGGKAKRKAA